MKAEAIQRLRQRGSVDSSSGTSRKGKERGKFQLAASAAARRKVRKCCNCGKGMPSHFVPPEFLKKVAFSFVQGSQVNNWFLL